MIQKTLVSLQDLLQTGFQPLFMKDYVALRNSASDENIKQIVEIIHSGNYDELIPLMKSHYEIICVFNKWQPLPENIRKIIDISDIVEK